MSFRLATLALALASAVTAAANALAQSDPTTVDAQKIEGVSDLEVSASVSTGTSAGLASSAPRSSVPSGFFNPANGAVP